MFRRWEIAPVRGTRAVARGVPQRGLRRRVVVLYDSAMTGSFELQPTLRGDLMELRPLELDDFEALFAAASDPLIWEQHPENDRYRREVFQRFFDGAIESRGAFAIIDRASGRIIGSSRYWNLKPEKSEVEIGWTFLERAFWGGKFNLELKRLMTAHAFRFVDRVVFVAGENNQRSCKALEKIGAQFLCKVERPDRDGNMAPNVVYALTRPPRH
jgi:RimJ/RimL family protein N-acetyltransferase